jgi:hypothetical protein
VGILEIGDAGPGPGIEGLEEGGARGRGDDLHAAVLEVGRRRVDGPLALADHPAVRGEFRTLPGMHAGLHGLPACEERLAAGLELPGQGGEEPERIGRQHPGGGGGGRPADGSAEARGGRRHGRGLPFGVGGWWERRHRAAGRLAPGVVAVSAAIRVWKWFQNLPSRPP